MFSVQNGELYLALQRCLRLLQLDELSAELGDAVLSSLHSSWGVAVLGNDPEDALYALHAVGTLLGGGLQACEQLLRRLPRISCRLRVPAPSASQTVKGQIPGR